MNDTPETPVTPDNDRPMYRFTLVMAEVVFSCEMGIQTRRIQFISKADTDTFPRSRLIQMQQLAAASVIKETKDMSNGAIKKIDVEAVYLLGTIDCGWMTEEEFLHNETALVASGAMDLGDTDDQGAEASGTTEDAAAGTDKVVPIRPR